MLNKKMLALALSLFSFSLFFTVTAAVVFLSNATSEAVFSKAYWTNGNFHQFFLDTVFYEFISFEMFTNLSPQLFINLPSFLWACAGIALLWLLKRNQIQSMKALVSVSIILLSFPYIWSMVTFKTNEISLVESGPILAFTLISVMYLVWPLTIVCLKALFTEDSDTAPNR